MQEKETRTRGVPAQGGVFAWGGEAGKGTRAPQRCQGAAGALARGTGARSRHAGVSQHRPSSDSPLNGCRLARHGTAWHGTAWHSTAGIWPWATAGAGWSWEDRGTPGLRVALRGHPLPTSNGTQHRVGIRGAADGTPHPCCQAPWGARGTHGCSTPTWFRSGLQDDNIKHCSSGSKLAGVLLFGDSILGTWGPYSFLGRQLPAPRRPHCPHPSSSITAGAG